MAGFIRLVGGIEMTDPLRLTMADWMDRMFPGWRNKEDDEIEALADLLQLTNDMMSDVIWKEQTEEIEWQKRAERKLKRDVRNKMLEAKKQEPGK